MGDGAACSDVGSEDAGVDTALFSTVKAWPQDVVSCLGSRLSVEVVVWAVVKRGDRPMRERRVVRRREDLRIVISWNDVWVVVVFSNRVTVRWLTFGCG
jgi:hypothetical protein